MASSIDAKIQMSKYFPDAVGRIASAIFAWHLTPFGESLLSKEVKRRSD